MVSFCMKRDGRTLDHQTLETIRLMAIERVREGERPSEEIEATEQDDSATGTAVDVQACGFDRCRGQGQSRGGMIFWWATYCRAFLTRATIASGVSTVMSCRSMQPTMICLPSSVASTAQSSFA